MRRALTSLCLSALLLLAAAPHARPYTLQFTGTTPIRWGTNTITVTLAPSITSPPANFGASDVNGAVRRALRRWSDAANINFVINTGGPDAVPSTNDGVNTISVSSANANFVRAGGEAIGRTRVSFDPATGLIGEADIALSADVAFSSDASPNTYDVESVFVHEIGHFLGLNHSALIGASMTPRGAQSFTNGSFTLAQTTIRTLSDDDLAGIRSVYGQRTQRDVGSIQGTTNYPFAGAHAWAENAVTGRVVGSAITRSDGSFRIDQVPPGSYRVNVEYLDGPIAPTEITSKQGPYSNLGDGPAFRSTSATTTVSANATSNVVLSVVTVAPSVNLRSHGINGIMHGGPMPLAPGNTYRYYVGGDGVDQIPAANFSVDSPFFSVNAASYQSSACPGGCTESFLAAQLGYPVVSFDLRVLDDAKVGDYSLHARTSAGDNAYLAGALAVDPYTDRVELNPIDATDFFVRQQYRDFLSREPDPAGFADWVNLINSCPNPNNSVPTDPSARCDRSATSASFFLSDEFKLKGFYAYRFYRVAFGSQPSYDQMSADMIFLSGSTAQEVYQKRAAYAAAFVARPAFQSAYGNTSNDTYVNTLMGRYGLLQIATPNPASPDDFSQANRVTLTRADLINRLNAGSLTRAQVLRAIADSDQVGVAEQNNAFVSMQYFGYLKRDIDAQGFNDWMTYLNTHPGDYHTMVFGFIYSPEYRSRFGQV